MFDIRNSAFITVNRIQPNSKENNLHNPEKTIEYVLRIGPSDRYRHLHIQHSGRIVFFRVQYETNIGGDWYPVVRYDTAHGFAHRDLLNIHGNIKKTPLFNQNYNDALSFAESDLKTNWLFYKQAFTEGSGDE